MDLKLEVQKINVPARPLRKIKAVHFVDELEVDIIRVSHAPWKEIEEWLIANHCKFEMEWDFTYRWKFPNKKVKTMFALKWGHY